MKISGFGIILFFIIGGLLFILITLGVGRILRPERPNDEKLSTYESGEQPYKNAWTNFNVRFYVVALIFVLFEVELVFLFPWGIVFGNAQMIADTNGLWGWFALMETLIFIGLLAIGLIYVWANGMLDWVKPQPKTENIKTIVPNNLYQEINKKFS